MTSEVNENFSTGYIKVFRSVKDNWIWDDPNKLKWWMDILLSVNYSDRKIMIGDQLIECKRGQSINSLETWAKRWRVDKSKVRRFFNLLQSDNMIVLENVKKTTRLTVCNYSTYNDSRNEDETIVTQSRHDGDTIVTPREESKEREEGKEDKKAKALNGHAIKPVVFKKEEVELKTKFHQLQIPADSKEAWPMLKAWIDENKPEFVEPYITAWNVFASFYGFPSVIGINDQRRKKFRIRIKEPPFDFFQILGMAKKSDFLKTSSWFGFDWIIENQSNYLKLLEGNYKT